MSESTIKDIQTRRAIRRFQAKAPAAALLDTVLETGTYAPTGQGKQAPVIIAVQDPQLRAQLTRMNAEYATPGTDPYYGAPVIVLVLADSTVSTFLAISTILSLSIPKRSILFSARIAAAPSVLPPAMPA